MDGDAELLRDYATTRSDRAFARLVERHIDLVYSAELRRVGGDPHRAAEVTQMVFIDLARKASSLVRHSALVGWLHQSTRWAASNLRRAEQRRTTHECAAAIELLTANQAEAQAVEWEALRPLLDAALDELRDADREAVLLRYFNNCTFAEVGHRLGTGENAARMRVERALDKLHVILRRKGLAGGVAALGAAMTKNAVAAAPAELAAAVTPAATAAGSIAAGAGAGGAAAILMSKVTMAVIGAGVVSLAVLCLQQQQELAAEREALVRDREQHSARQAVVARIATQVERLQADLARLPSAEELPPPDPVELERKRLDMVIRKGEMDSYAPLFRRMKLSSAQVDQFKTLLVERAQAIYDAGKLAEQEGIMLETFAETEEFKREAARGIDAQIANVIGTENAQLFADYQRPYGAFATRPRWDDALKEDPQDWERAKALRDLWERTCSEVAETSLAQMSPLPLPKAFLDGAKAIMTAEQYRELLADQEASRIRARMLEIERAAAYAGKLKLSKGSARDYAPTNANNGGTTR